MLGTSEMDVKNIKNKVEELTSNLGSKGKAAQDGQCKEKFKINYSVLAKKRFLSKEENVNVKYTLGSWKLKNILFGIVLCGCKSQTV